MDDLGERVVDAGSGRLDNDRTGRVQRAGEHLVADSLLDRHRFAGDRRFVQRGAAIDDLSVGGDPFSGANDEPVTNRQQLEIDLLLDAVDETADPFRGQVHQCPDRPAGAVGGELLERF